MGKAYMNDLDQKILYLKSKGKSLRQIRSNLHLSHEAIRNRLNTLSSGDQVSTHKGGKGLTVLAMKNEKVSTGSNADKSRASGKTKDTVNQVSTSNAPCPTITEGVNPLETPSDKLPDVFQGVLSEVDDLFGAIKEFLESHSIEVYRMNTEPEGYQAKNNGQVIRIYVQRKMEEPKSKGER